MMKIASLNLKWKAFRNFFDFQPSDAELARGLLKLGENAAQTFSKMLSGDQGVSIDVLELLAERMSRHIAGHRALRLQITPPTDPAITPIDLAEMPVLAFINHLVGLSPNPEPDRLDKLHMEVLTALSMTEIDVWPATDLTFVIEKTAMSRSFAPYLRHDTEGPMTFEAGRDRGQFIIKGPRLSDPQRPPLIYSFLRKDPAPVGRRIWEQSFAETVRWLPSPFKAQTTGSVPLFPEPMPVQPEPGLYRVVAVAISDPAVLRTIEPRLDRRKPVTHIPPPILFDEASSLRFLTNVGRAVERRDPAVAVAAADYRVAVPADVG